MQFKTTTQGLDPTTTGHKECQKFYSNNMKWEGKWKSNNNNKQIQAKGQILPPVSSQQGANGKRKGPGQDRNSWDRTRRYGR